MGKFDDVLICTDLDGTLLRNDKSVSAENKAAIEYFKSEGGYFTFITGRMPYYVGEAYAKAQPNAPFGCANGGGLYDYAAKEYVYQIHTGDRVLPLARLVDEMFPNVGIMMYTFERIYFSKENSAAVHFRNVTGVENIVCPYDAVPEPLAKVMFSSFDEEEIRGMEAALRAHPLADEFQFVRSENYLYEILPKGVDKGRAIDGLVEHLHLDANKTIAVGDYYNDVEMLRKAKVGVAVANACPEAIEAADYVTVSNEEHAIAQVIADLENGKYF